MSSFYRVQLLKPFLENDLGDCSWIQKLEFQKK